MPLPAPDLRTNRGTWAVPVEMSPAVGNAMTELLPAEKYDPAFNGQRLETTYLDTLGFRLRKARQLRSRYMTLRVRCYQPRPPAIEAYALSAKTEEQKFRLEISADDAHAITGGDFEVLAAKLPPDLFARLLEFTAGNDVLAVAAVRCLRYSVQDDQDRFTLDCQVNTDSGKVLPYGVLEYKTTSANRLPPDRIINLGLRPLKISKFLWATQL
jgi:hypothetical protein